MDSESAMDSGSMVGSLVDSQFDSEVELDFELGSATGSSFVADFEPVTGSSFASEARSWPIILRAIVGSFQ